MAFSTGRRALARVRNPSSARLTPAYVSANGYAAMFVPTRTEICTPGSGLCAHTNAVPARAYNFGVASFNISLTNSAALRNASSVSPRNEKRRFSSSCLRCTSTT
jgi:hypothetical protein